MANDHGFIRKFKNLLSSGKHIHTPADRTRFVVEMVITSDLRAVSNITLDQRGGSSVSQEEMCFHITEFATPNYRLSAGVTELASPFGIANILNHGTYMPQNREFNITFLDMEVSVLEQCMVPWIRSLTSPYRTQSGATHVTTDFTVTAYANNGNVRDSSGSSPDVIDKAGYDEVPLFRFKLMDCFPLMVDTPDFTYDKTGIQKRKIQFRCSDIKTFIHKDYATSGKMSSDNLIEV